MAGRSPDEPQPAYFPAILETCPPGEGISEHDFLQHLSATIPGPARSTASARFGTRYDAPVSLIFATMRALLIASALTILTMADIGIPDANYWDDKLYFVYIALGAAFFSYLPGGLLQWYARRREAEEAYQYQQKIQVALVATLVKIEKNTTADWTEVGVHAFWVRNGLLSKRLVNIGGVRLGPKPSMDRPVWTCGKGVVGRAWKEGDMVAKNWASFYEARYGDEAKKEAWRAMGKAQRYGLSWQELAHTADYTQIIAYPVMNLAAKVVVGCVSVDGPLTRQDRDSPAMRATMQDLARAIFAAGEPPSYWFQQRV